jgi:hypothetical protein
MSSSDTDELAFLETLEREANELAGLKELENWYHRRHNDIWEPFRREMQRLQHEEGVDTSSPELHDRIARELGVAERSRQLQALYQKAVDEFMGRVAEELLKPDSEASREVVEKFDAAWRELASR